MFPSSLYLLSVSVLSAPKRPVKRKEKNPNLNFPNFKLLFEYVCILCMYSMYVFYSICSFNFLMVYNFFILNLFQRFFHAQSRNSNYNSALKIEIKQKTHLSGPTV